MNADVAAKAKAFAAGLDSNSKQRLQDLATALFDAYVADGVVKKIERPAFLVFVANLIKDWTT